MRTQGNNLLGTHGLSSANYIWTNYQFLMRLAEYDEGCGLIANAGDKSMWFSTASYQKENSRRIDTKRNKLKNEAKC